MLNPDYNIILASGSPRRKELLASLGVSFTIKTYDVEEVYPITLKKEAIPNYLAKLKAEPHKPHLKAKDIVITSDTIVWHNHKALGKPTSKNEARKMLHSLSGQTHQVISSVCLTTVQTQQLVSDTTQVTFNTLTEAEIEYYINTQQPFDKAGGYGIQEWIGLSKIKSITGSYFTVMGMPTHLVYEQLKVLTQS